MSWLYSRLSVRCVCIGVLISYGRTIAMVDKRTYRAFQYKEAVFNICCREFDAVTREIVRERHILEKYIELHRSFGRSLSPVKISDNAPDAVSRMAFAAGCVGVGPMAAVAGCMAQLAGEAGLQAGASEVIVDNGGDIYVKAASRVVIGLYTGPAGLPDELAFSVRPQDTPLAICSSSGHMGHSQSLGSCDLATVVASDAALADAAATQAANLVKSPEDVDRALERICAIAGISGVLIVKDDRVGLAGKLPDLVRLK